MASSDDVSQLLTDTKTAFLNSQIRILNTQLVSPTSSEYLPGSVVEKLLFQANKKISAQNRRVYSLESQRHVVEQIDGLYWQDVLAQGLPVKKAETAVRKDIDFVEARLNNGYEQLPENWEDVVLSQPAKRLRTSFPRHNDKGVSTLQSKQEATVDQDYAALRLRLTQQHQRREELRKKLQQYQILQKLLLPYRDAKVEIQPNLVTRDNKELENELSRMRLLLARVGAAVQQRELSTKPRESGNIEETPNKLEAVLGLI